ncbi:MAG: permease [Deltaproteobacteria bacterium]|nr:permease [Deltaproteobacteria bacterium]
MKKIRLYILIPLSLLLWLFVFSHLDIASKFLTYKVLQFSPTNHFGKAAEFFIFEVPKVLMLLVMVVFGVGILRSFITPERTRQMLAGKKEFYGNVLAALLGIVTPFCTCSAIPLFIGFLTAGVPLGTTFSFLVSAPMVNEIALALLFGMFGWKVALLYLSTGLVIAILSGWILGTLHLEKWVEPWVLQSKANVDHGVLKPKIAWSDRVQYGLTSVKDIVGKVWLYIIIGIAVGAGIHGYVPQDFMASIMGKSSWWAVPIAVLVGIPMYSNAAGIIPVVQALLGKGAALGTVLAFMMAVISLSLPEILILRKVLKLPLILTFVGIVACGILLVGYLFNWLL